MEREKKGNTFFKTNFKKIGRRTERQKEYKHIVKGLRLEIQN